jgi:hypothetical protein
MAEPEADKGIVVLQGLNRWSLYKSKVQEVGVSEM